MRHFIVIALACLITNGVYSDTTYRLNTPIRPYSYSISIKPYFDTNDANAFTFDGEVNIDFTTVNSTSEIKLHSQDLDFTESDVSVSSGGNIINLTTTNPLQFSPSYSFVFINLLQPLEANVNYTLTILYKGPIREDLNGFYRNYYMENGTRKWLGATQMEPTHARKVFPCFDEPDLKATFVLIIDRLANFVTTLGNTKRQSSTPVEGGYVRDIFYPTPRMSTYLVAFLISEFEIGGSYTNGSREFKVYTRPDAANQSDYTLEVGVKIVDALSEYFQIDYYSTNEYLKMDHVALPDFRAGAMENWGLIDYREALLLYVPEESEPYYKYRVAQIVAHETTHMWFGNLVTCHWWSNTWLNEGFANYFQDYIAAEVEPELKSEDILVTGSVYSAYDADDSPDSPPITNNNVNSPEEISGHFGTITYQKAGSVIRMMHHLIGDDAFKFGLNAYLTANQFEPGYPEYLYQALNDGVLRADSLSAYPNATITNIMSNWIEQAGHPILNVNINYEENRITLSQKRFYVNSSYSSDEIYKIPITYATKVSPDFNNTKPAFIMESAYHEFNIANISDDHRWIIFNVQETGFYRVNYDAHSWQIISSALKGSDRELIHHLNRAKIVNDLFAFLYADEVRFETIHDILGFLFEETNYSVWLATIRGLNRLRNIYMGTDALQDIEAYSLRLMDGAIERIGYEIKSHGDFEALRNRLQILEFACRLGHVGCINFSVQLFRALRENGTEVPPSLRRVAYCSGLRFGDGDDYEYLWQRMSSTNVANEARLIGDALGCTSDESKLSKYLLSMLEENSPIRIQDLTVPLTSVLSNYSNVHVVMESLMENYTLWSSIHTSMSSVMSTLASALRTEQDCATMEAWISSCSECDTQILDSVRNALARVRASADWAEQHKNDIVRSLRGHAAIAAPSIFILILGVATVFFRL